MCIEKHYTAKFKITTDFNFECIKYILIKIRNE